MSNAVLKRQIEKKLEELSIVNQQKTLIVLKGIPMEVVDPELSEEFKVGNMGGMRRSKATGTLVLISDNTKGLYHDQWQEGRLHYTGMGKVGDQVLEGNQNKTLAESDTNGVKVYLFEVNEPGKYTFVGRVKLADAPYQETQPDDNGQNRKVWVFPLEKASEETETQDDSEWWPLLSEYDPGITKERWLELLNNPDVFNSAWKSVLAKFYDFGGTATCKQIEIHYGGQAQAYNKIGSAIGMRVHKVTQCPLNSGKNYFTILFFGRKANKEEEGTYVWKMRPELYEALTEHDIKRFLTKAGQFDSWTIVDEETAIKKCDKSFYDYNGSGVPKGISWFFGAEDLDLGQVVRLKLLYQGHEFEGLVRNESSDRRRVRIFWNADLGKLFVGYRELEGSTATFHWVDDNTYEITMKGDEAEVSVKGQIDQIKAFIAARGFSYDDGLIENFYLSLKSKPFVILAGTSGTGKTRLVRLFAEAIGATFEAVPVRPDWSDSTDLFGHVDLNGHFVAGKILNFLWEAKENPSQPYMLCLDEMNLARVEYYMSDFLSVIETRDWSDDRIVTDPLVSIKDYGIDTEAANHYGEIRFPENLYIVGTVNMDETTFQFSRKVLDRANTIEFNYVNLVPEWSDAAEDAVAQEMENDFLRSKYLRLADCPDKDREYASDVSAELEKMNTVLAQANAHVGYRVRDEIVFYLLNNREAGLLDEKAAMDNEILQKILPRIHGSSASVKSMLCDLFKEVAGDYEGYQTESNNTADRMLDMLRKNENRRGTHEEAAKAD